MITAKISPERFKALADDLDKATGIALSGSQGTISHLGMIATYKYDQTTLTVTVIKGAFLHSISSCEKQLRDQLEQRGIDTA